MVLCQSTLPQSATHLLPLNMVILGLGIARLPQHTKHPLVPRMLCVGMALTTMAYPSWWIPLKYSLLVQNYAQNSCSSWQNLGMMRHLGYSLAMPSFVLLSASPLYASSHQWWSIAQGATLTTWQMSTWTPLHTTNVCVASPRLSLDAQHTLLCCKST